MVRNGGKLMVGRDVIVGHGGKGESWESWERWERWATVGNGGRWWVMAGIMENGACAGDGGYCGKELVLVGMVVMVGNGG